MNFIIIIIVIIIIIQHFLREFSSTDKINC